MTKIKRLAVVVLILSLSTGIVCAAPLIVPAENASAKASTIVVPSPKGSKAKAKATRAEMKKKIKEYKKENPTKKPAGGGKSKVLAAVLAFFLGNLGIHRFYMGQSQQGFMQLGGTVVGITLLVICLKDYVSGLGESFPTLALIGYIILLAVGIWALVDFIRILTGGLEPEEGFNS